MPVDNTHKPEDGFEFCKKLADSAIEHSMSSSEPDMGIGDLEQALNIAWRIMDPLQRRAFEKECKSLDLLAYAEEQNDD